MPNIGKTNLGLKPNWPIKKLLLINVIASNSRGSCFLYGDDYSGVEKTGEAIAEFLLKAIDDIGPSNVLQVVIDNAPNCKAAAGKEIEKVSTDRDGVNSCS